jgi:actin-related protein
MAFYTSGDSVNAVVADIGSYASKIGFAGEDFPRAYFRSVRAAGERGGVDLLHKRNLI